MKKLTSLLAVVALTFSGCATTIPWFNSVSDGQITTGVSVAAATALHYGIPDAAKRTVIANYIDVVASALRTVTGTPTTTELTALINKSVPASVRTAYPELMALATPIVIQVYEYAQSKFGSNSAKLYKVLNDIAVGLETGASTWISKS